MTEFKTCNCSPGAQRSAQNGAAPDEALGNSALPVASAPCCGESAQCAGDVQDVPPVSSCIRDEGRMQDAAQTCDDRARFVALHDGAHGNDGAQQALARAAALSAIAALPAAAPVPIVQYHSKGMVLIIGQAEQALPWAKRLADQAAAGLTVTALLTGGGGATPLQADDAFTLCSGGQVQISGWLGAFEVSWQQDHPIDLALRAPRRGRAEAGPEAPMVSLDPVDPENCHRRERFDLIFDLSDTPLIGLHQPPFGYFAPDADPNAQSAAAMQLMEMVGEFEKPKYFQYKERLCAHGRNRKTGCTACNDICSAQAIRSDGNRIEVDPHLCAGCGACTTVCPSGALAYAYPDAPHTGKRFKAALDAYAKAGGSDAAILLHNEKRGRRLVHALTHAAPTAARVLPSRLIPIEVQHTASVGIELWLAAIAYGATGVAVLATEDDAPQYLDALTSQMAVAQTILSALGYEGVHLQLVRADSANASGAGAPDASALSHALQALPKGQVPRQPAAFHVAADKRNALDFALDHLYRHAPQQPSHIDLPAGAPFGAIRVDTDACTLCMACTGACPESALLSGQGMPQLRFIEKNCVQCGLCAQTCPEQAIALVPQLAFGEQVAKPVVLHESEPFCCIRCNKPIGTLQMVEAMFSKLSQHSAFADHLDRLRMCGDCRVVDMMQGRRTVNIVELKR